MIYRQDRIATSGVQNLGYNAGKSQLYSAGVMLTVVLSHPFLSFMAVVVMSFASEHKGRCHGRTALC